MEAASSKPRPGKMSQKVTCSLTATQSQRNCAATFLPVSSMPFTILRRAASRRACQVGAPRRATRSEEHTSELQSRLHLVCRLLLEKKKTQAPHVRTPLPVANDADLPEISLTIVPLCSSHP